MALKPDQCTLATSYPQPVAFVDLSVRQPALKEAPMETPISAAKVIA